MEKIRILDLFSGTGPVKKAATLNPDFECCSLDISCKFSQPENLIDIHKWNYRTLSRHRFYIIAVQTEFIEPLFEQRILTAELARGHVICSVLHTVAGSAVGECILPGPLLGFTVAGSLCEQQFLTLDTAVTYHCCQAVVCTCHCAFV